MLCISQMQHILLDLQKEKSDSLFFSKGFKVQLHEIDSLTKILTKLPKFDGSATYRDAALRLAAVYKKAVTAYYPQMATIYKTAKDTTADSTGLALKEKLKKDSTTDSSLLKLPKKTVKKQPTTDSVALKLVDPLRREQSMADSIFLKEKAGFARKYKFPELE